MKNSLHTGPSTGWFSGYVEPCLSWALGWQIIRNHIIDERPPRQRPHPGRFRHKDSIFSLPGVTVLRRHRTNSRRKRRTRSLSTRHQIFLRFLIASRKAETSLSRNKRRSEEDMGLVVRFASGSLTHGCIIVVIFSLSEVCVFTRAIREHGCRCPRNRWQVRTRGNCQWSLLRNEPRRWCTAIRSLFRRSRWQWMLSSISWPAVDGRRHTILSL